ncbi:MAG: hypothetical protein ACRDS0_23970 [Pseudonocardiaceae bacterium]
MGEPRSRKQQRERLVRALRAEGRSRVEVAEALRQRYRFNARVALRYAHEWSQRQAADEWNKRWPDELKTVKAFSYWEQWPSRTGHAPTFDNLNKLAELYECAVSDLLGDLADFRHRDSTLAAGTALAARQSNIPVIPHEFPVPVMAAGLPLPDDIAALLVPYLGEAYALLRSSFSSARDRDIAYDRLVQLFSQWADSVKRRELLRILGCAASVAAGAPLLEGLHPEEQVRLARAIEAPNRVDATTIDHIEAVLWRCIRQDDALGAQATLDTVCAQRNLVRLILPECQSALRPQLLSLYSHHSLQAGWLLYDLNDFDGAGYYFEHARSTAHEAEDTELGAFVLCMMSHLATWRGQPRVGIDHAVAAQGWAAQTDEPRLQAYAADVAARAYAGVGQKTLCLRQLDNIGGSLATVSNGAAEDSVAHFYSNGQFAGTRSLCLLQLHDTPGALGAAQEALATADPAFVRNFAFTKLYLGEAYTAAGGLQEAAATIGEAAVLTARNRSARLVGRVRAARDQLAQYQVPSVVRGLDEQLHAYGLSCATAVSHEP